MTNETTTVTGTPVNDYELVFIMSPEAAEETVTSRTDNITKIVTNGGGTMTAVNK